MTALLYLLSRVDNYLSERSLWYWMDEGHKGYIVTAGVTTALCTHCGRLYIVKYLSFPSQIVGFADDLAGVVLAQHPIHSPLCVTYVGGGVRKL